MARSERPKDLLSLRSEGRSSAVIRASSTGVQRLPLGGCSFEIAGFSSGAVRSTALPPRKSSSTATGSFTQNPGHRVDERNGEWLLKNSCFVKIAGIWEIESVYQNGDRRCRASYCKFCSTIFRRVSFSTSHGFINNSVLESRLRAGGVLSWGLISSPVRHCIAG
jgi:hypothetical protein